MNLKWTWIEPEPEFCNFYQINTEILLYTFQMNEDSDLYKTDNPLNLEFGNIFFSFY